MENSKKDKLLKSKHSHLLQSLFLQCPVYLAFWISLCCLSLVWPICMPINLLSDFSKDHSSATNSTRCVHEEKSMFHSDILCKKNKFSHCSSPIERSLEDKNFFMSQLLRVVPN